MKEGLIWRIGNGESVSVWEDNWIPRSSALRPLGHKPDQNVRKVSELLLPDGGGWDEQKLRQTFYDGDTKDILKVPIGRAGTADYLAWNYTKKRAF
jgi:hypothetical protein